MSELADAILEHAKEPRIRLALGEDVLTGVRPGGMIVVMGPTGAGKTSLVAGLLVEHARHVGPVVVLSRELPAEQLAARAVGLQCDASWLDVLEGRVARPEMVRVLDLPRMVVLDRKDATLAALAQAVADVKAEHPGEPVLVAADYVQIIESSEREVRARAADVIAQIDEMARAQRVAVLAISQMSRVSARAARAGELVGADTTDGGAESAAIERTAEVTLTIGSSGPEREDGTKAVNLSIGKDRMGGGDRVVPMSYCGRSGRWRVTGDARPAAEVKAEIQADGDRGKIDTAKLAIIGFATRAEQPFNRGDCKKATRVQKGTSDVAIDELLAEGAIVEIRKKQPRTSYWYLWTRERATAAGLAVIERDPPRAD